MTGLERDVNVAIKQVLEHLDEAAREAPEAACEPYQAEARRKAVIKAIWGLYRRVVTAREEA